VYLVEGEVVQWRMKEDSENSLSLFSRRADTAPAGQGGSRKKGQKTEKQMRLRCGQTNKTNKSFEQVDDWGMLKKYFL